MCLAIAKPKGCTIPQEYLARAMFQNSDGAGFAYHANGEVTVVRGFTDFDKFYAAYREKEHHAMLVHFRYTTHGATNQANCHPFPLADGALIHNGIISGMGESRYNFGNSYTMSTVRGPITGKMYEKYGPLKERRELTIECIMAAYDLQNDPVGRDTAEKMLAEDMEKIVAGKSKNTTYTYPEISVVTDVFDMYKWALDDRVQAKQDTRSDTREFVEDYLAGWTEDMMRRGKKMIERVIGNGSKVATLHNSGAFLIFNEGAGHYNDGVWYSNSCYRAAGGSSHIPTTTDFRQQGERGDKFDGYLARERRQRLAGPVTEYTMQNGVLAPVNKKAKGKVKVKAKGKAKGKSNVTELRPTKDDSKRAFLDSMVDGLAELDDEVVSQRDWVREFPHLAGMLTED